MDFGGDYDVASIYLKIGSLLSELRVCVIMLIFYN